MSCDNNVTDTQSIIEMLPHSLHYLHSLQYLQSLHYLHYLHYQESLDLSST